MERIPVSKAQHKPPFWFFPIACAAALWFGFACLAYYRLTIHSGEDLDLLQGPQRILRSAMPVWMLLVYAVSVGSGLLGSMSLLLRMTWGPRLFLIALAAASVQIVWLSVKVPLAIDLETPEFGIQLASIGAAILLAALSRFALRRGWLI